jgi:hypothetical protein
VFGTNFYPEDATKLRAFVEAGLDVGTPAAVVARLAVGEGAGWARMCSVRAHRVRREFHVYLAAGEEVLWEQRRFHRALHCAAPERQGGGLR